MQPDAVSLVSPGMIAKFFRSGIAGRMKMADRQGKLRKESQFILGIPAREMKAADSDELVLIQGIIDAWFEEKDGLVIVDYKTDRVKEGEEQTLLDHYQVQLQYYARALSQITGKRVKEAVIYSLTIQKEITAPDRSIIGCKKRTDRAVFFMQTYLFREDVALSHRRERMCAVQSQKLCHSAMISSFDSSSQKVCDK